MKLWVRLVIGAIVLFGVMYALSALVGMLFSLAVAGLILAGIVALISNATGGPKLRAPSGKTEKRIDTAAERALKELERKVNGE